MPAVNIVVCWQSRQETRTGPMGHGLRHVRPNFGIGRPLAPTARLVEEDDPQAKWSEDCENFRVRYGLSEDLLIELNTMPSAM